MSYIKNEIEDDAMTTYNFYDIFHFFRFGSQFVEIRNEVWDPGGDSLEHIDPHFKLVFIH